MSGFAPGDVVVCVDATPHPDYPAPLEIRVGGVYKVARVCPLRPNKLFGLGHGLELTSPQCPERNGFSEHRFRKIDPATDEFTEQMRALRPVRAQAGCR